METRHLLNAVRSSMEKEFGPRLKGVVLFGSFARGEQVQESDVDMLVLLDGEVRYAEDVRRISRHVYPLTLQQPDHPIHAIPVSASDYATGKCGLYRRVAKEGVRA